jgi:hypothetical protein
MGWGRFTGWLKRAVKKYPARGMITAELLTAIREGAKRDGLTLSADDCREIADAFD